MIKGFSGGCGEGCCQDRLFLSTIRTAPEKASIHAIFTGAGV
jgi:hypothetical protein